MGGHQQIYVFSIHISFFPWRQATSSVCLFRTRLLNQEPSEFQWCCPAVERPNRLNSDRARLCPYSKNRIVLFRWIGSPNLDLMSDRLPLCRMLLLQTTMLLLAHPRSDADSLCSSAEVHSVALLICIFAYQFLTSSCGKPRPTWVLHVARFNPRRTVVDLGEFLCVARYTGWVGLSKSAMLNCKNQSGATRLISHQPFLQLQGIHTHSVSSLPHSFVKSVKATNRLTIFLGIVWMYSRTQVCKVRDRKYFPPSRMCEIFQTDLKALDLPWPPWPLKVKKKCPGYHPIRSPIVTAHL